VVFVSLAEDGNNLFNNFGLSKERFMSFLGQSSTFVFVKAAFIIKGKIGLSNL
jgi:hypothetical protein